MIETETALDIEFALLIEFVVFEIEFVVFAWKGAPIYI